MARRKKKTKNYINVDSTLKQLTTQLTDPRVIRTIYSSARGVRNRLLKLDYFVLRNVVEKVELIEAIINTRSDQIIPFAKYATEEGDKGFKFELERTTEKTSNNAMDDNEIIQLSNFIEQTGFTYDPDREDDFADFIQQIVREILTIDQIATEIQYNRIGEVAAFWLLDGATIKRVEKESDFKKGIRFVQEIDQKIYNTYTPEQIVFDYKFKRADIRYRGYGYSPTEMSIDIITTLLFGYNYMRDQLVKDKVPKGFISVMGDVGKTQLDSIREYWYYAMNGAGGQWNIPIVPSGKDGVGLDFKQLNQSNKDMEYHKLMMFISSLIAAVFSIDLAEMGIKTDDSTALIGESNAPRVEASKDRGLASMLSFIEQYVNKILRKVTTKYRFKFVGLVKEDVEKKASVRAKQLATHKTINEIREEDGLDKIDEDYANVVLNPQAVQIYMGNQSQGEGEEGGDNEGGFGTYEPENEEVNKSLSYFRELTNRKEKDIHIKIE